jgi:DNA-binding GntR family transcriptional regulator
MNRTGDQGDSLSQIAYDQIRRKIVSLELPPGGIISEGELQAELGLGRTPIREALQRLSLEKLVIIVPRRGMFVTEIGITDLQRVFEVRMHMETLATRLAARRGTDEHWARMDAVLGVLPGEGGPLDASDNEALIEIDEICHHIIYEAADNRFLSDSLTTLYTLSLRLWYYFLSRIGDMRGAILEHRLILEALKSGDSDRAVALMERHLNAFQVEIQAAMMDTTDPERAS